MDESDEARVRRIAGEQGLVLVKAGNHDPRYALDFCRGQDREPHYGYGATDEAAWTLEEVERYLLEQPVFAKYRHESAHEPIDFDRWQEVFRGPCAARGRERGRGGSRNRGRRRSPHRRTRRRRWQGARARGGGVQRVQVAGGHDRAPGEPRHRVGALAVRSCGRRDGTPRPMQEGRDRGARSDVAHDGSSRPLFRDEAEGRLVWHKHCAVSLHVGGFFKFGAPTADDEHDEERIVVLVLGRPEEETAGNPPMMVDPPIVLAFAEDEELQQAMRAERYTGGVRIHFYFGPYDGHALTLIFWHGLLYETESGDLAPWHGPVPTGP